MQNDIEQPKSRNNPKIIGGSILLVVGCFFLLQQISGFMLAPWVISFPSAMIVFGLYSGAKHNFRSPFSYMLIVIGSIFLLNDIFPGVNFDRMLWPVIIISIGILMIVKRNHTWDRERWGRRRNRKHWNETDNWNQNQAWAQNQQFSWDKKVDPDAPAEPAAEEPASTSANTGYAYSGRTYKGYPIEDYLDATSIFGSANKTIFTKTFRGGEIVNIFGGAEIDFTQSDITGQVVIDVTQIFGGIKLLVPPHWHVTSDTVSLFAGFDDKRKQKINLANDKVLMITGTSIFAGIEIRSY